MVSSITVSWPFGVILTLRSAVFICGLTDEMVPCTMVPFLSSIVTVSLAHFMRNLAEEGDGQWVWHWVCIGCACFGRTEVLARGSSATWR